MKIVSDKAIQAAADIIVLDMEMSAKRTEVLFPGTKDRTIRAVIAGLQKLIGEEPSENHCDASNGVGVCPDEGECCGKEPMKPKDDLMGTVELMGSGDYKDRFKAEYYQVKIRYDRLHTMCNKYEAGTLEFTPTCSLELLKEQKAAMGQYLHVLEVRAEIEGITL